MKRLWLSVLLSVVCVGTANAQQGVLSLESYASQFQSVRPQGMPNNTIPLRPNYSLPVIPCIATAGAPSFAEGAYVNCSVDLSGNLRVSSGGGGGGTGTSSNFGAAFPSAGTAAGFSDGTNMQGARVFDLDTGGGTQYVTGMNLRFSAGGGSVEAGTAANPLRVDPTGTTTQPVSAASLPLPTGAATEATLATRLADSTFTGRFVAGFVSADGVANLTTTAIHGFGFMYNGTTWDRIRGTIANGLLVNVSNATLAVTQSGTWNINNITGTVSLPTGAATEATLSTRLADSTFTGRFAVAYADADGIANQTTTAIHGQSYMYNGTTWDRMRGTIASGLLVNVSNAFVLDATITNRLPAGSTPADNETNAVSFSRLGVYNYIFDGTTWDRWTGAVTGSGNFTVVQPTGTNLHIVCDAGCGSGAAFADSSAFTFGTSSINNMGAVVDDTATNTVAENSAGAPRMNTNRILYGMPTNATGTALYPSAAALADATANPTLTQIGTFLHGFNGTTWDRLRSSIANGLLVDVSDAFLLDATLTARFPAGTNPADNESNAVNVSRIGAFNYIFDGTTWDRWTGAVSQAGTWNINNISGTISLPTGAATEATLGTRLADSTFTGRFAAAFTSADGIANQTTTAIHGFGYMYNGTTWDRIRGTTAAGLLVNVSNATLAVTQSGTWNINNISGTISLPTGAATEATLATRVADSTITGRLPAGSTPADNESNAVTTSRLGAYNYIFDGTTWDRWTGGVSQVGTWNINNISGTISLPTGAATEATLSTRLADATFTGRFAAAFTSADGIANQTTTAIHGFGYMFNGTTWDRVRGATATGLLVNVSNATLAVTQSGTWNIGTLTSITNTVTVQGTKTNNSAAPGTNNVGTLTAVATAAAPTYTEGNQVGLSTDLGGRARVLSESAANFNVRPDTSGATAAAPPARADYIGGLASGATGGLLSGVAVCDQYANVNVNTATTTLIVTGVAGRHVRICSLSLVTALANNVALLSGTGATCGTGTTGMSGGTTAATGWNFAANGGITQGNGIGVINQTNATGDSVCIATSAAAQLSGRIAFAIY